MSSLKRGREPNREESAFSRSFHVARQYAQRGVRSIHDVRALLDRRGVPPETATRVVLECRARGMLDDAACARLWGEHWARRGYAWAAIRAKLFLKGLDEPSIRHAASMLGGATGDVARARLLAVQLARRSRRSPGSSDAASRMPAGRRGERARLARRLAARGFDSDVIERVVSERFDPIPAE